MCPAPRLVFCPRASSDLVDLFVFQGHESLANEGEGAHLFANGVHARAFKDDDNSRAGGAPVERPHHAFGFELLDDAHLVVDEWSELVWLGDRASRNSDHVRLLCVVWVGMVTASDAAAATPGGR